MTLSGRTDATIYLHFPCFDGLVSAVLAMEFLEASRGWVIRRAQPVNYNLLGSWLDTRLEETSAVVDFLYHPQANFWADHHATTFLSVQARHDYEKSDSDRVLIYERNAPSCAMLLFDRLGAALSNDPRYVEMASWANKIDSANYSTVEEAIFGDDPAIEINMSLSDVSASSQGYCDLLLRSLRKTTLAETAALPAVRKRANAVRERDQRGLVEVQRVITCEPGDIAVFAVGETKNRTVNRYAPYLFFPRARYSVGLVYSDKHWKITAMRNPWLDFESVQLGEIFSIFGGGGHQRVASLLLPPGANAAKAVLGQIVAEIRKQDVDADHGSRRAYA